MKDIFDFENSNSEGMTWEEKVESFREYSNYLGKFDDYFGYAHCAGYNAEDQTFCLSRFVSGTWGDDTMEVVFDGKCYDCAVKFIAAYVEGLELGVKAMAGVPERMCRIYTKAKYDAEKEEE